MQKKKEKKTEELQGKKGIKKEEKKNASEQEYN